MSRRAPNSEELPRLRFAVGDRVQCKVGPGNGEDAWQVGTIVQLWYRESKWPTNRVAPYQVKLDIGPLIYAPIDEDRVCRAVSGFLAEGKIPVTVLTGFLGSGKTTLLNYILRAHHGKRYAVIENEVGQVGIDNMLLESPGYNAKSQESITLLDNGCLCCTVRGDLIEAIKGIVNAAKAKEKDRNPEDKSKALDGILIETTGIADPGPICKTFYGDMFTSTYCQIDGVITVVDAVNFIAQLTRERTEGAVNESAQQVAFADKVLLNKVDAATPEKLAQTMEAVRQVNQFVPITQCSLGKHPEAVSLSELLSIDAFDVSKMLDDKDIDLSVCGQVKELPAVAGEAPGHGDGHGHGSGHGGGHDDGHECSPDCDHGSHEAGHGDGHGHGHSFRHDTEIGSFVCELVGKPIRCEAFEHWLHELMVDPSNLYRYKGILAMTTPAGLGGHGGKVLKHVIQGVHDMCQNDRGQEWPKDTPFKSQLVLIGRKLDKEKWTKSFAQLG